MTWIWITVVGAGVFVAWMGTWRYRAGKRRRWLMERPAVDWNAMASSEFSGENDRLAIDIVVETIAQCFDIPRSQVYPDDDINLDYTYPTFWLVIMVGDPGEEIVETIRERIEHDYPPWDADCGPRVREIIADVSRHFESSGKGNVNNKEMGNMNAGTSSC